MVCVLNTNKTLKKMHDNKHALDNNSTYVKF